MKPGPEIKRRDLLKGGASLILGLAATGSAKLFLVTKSAAGELDVHVRNTAPDRLDTWLAINEDGSVTAYFGKMDMGQGVDTAVAQVVAEELDVAVDKVTVVMGDTALTPNQGGASGSSGCRLGAVPLRHAAAEARRVFLKRASDRLGQPTDALTVENGTVFVRGTPDKRVSYGDLIAGGFDTPMDWNQEYGNFLMASGRAEPKDPSAYSVVGAPVPRKDIPGKILATTEFCHHVTLPGMVHGRMVRPPVANARPEKVDTSSIADIPGADVVWEKDFLGVVADTEWGAIQAARRLKVEWSETEPAFPPMEQLFDYIRDAEPVASNAQAMFLGEKSYDPKPTLMALEKSERMIEAEYELPFQSHARMAPSVGLAHVADGQAVIYSDTQKPHYTLQGIAKMLDMAEDDVRVIWRPGPGSYGRSDADEAAFEAAFMSKKTGKPVRVQWMRDEGHAWDPKAPPAVISLKAGLDDNDSLTAWYFRAKGFSGWDVLYNAANPEDTLAGMLLGWEKGDEHNFGVPGESYGFPTSVKFWETVAPFQTKASPLRCSHMRAPQEPQIHFAHESFIDEVAAAIGRDPIAFRLDYVRDSRERDVLMEVALASGWNTRRSPNPDREDGDTLRGRGVALAAGYGSYVATVCLVEVNRETGKVWPRRIVVAHDCGLIINPQGLKGTIEGNVIQGLSRAMWEEVQFNEDMVRSVDWATYPIASTLDVPETIDIATINRPEEPAGGAGEPTHVTIAAALGNAVFDATGVRYRRLPLTPERIKAGLA